MLGPGKMEEGAIRRDGNSKKEARIKKICTEEAQQTFDFTRSLLYFVLQPIFPHETLETASVNVHVSGTLGDVPFVPVQ